MKWLVMWGDDEQAWFETDVAAKLRVTELMAASVQSEIDHGKVADWDIALLEVRGQVERTSDGARLVMR